MLMGRILPACLIALLFLSWADMGLCQEWDDFEYYLYQDPIAVGHTTAKINIRAEPSVDAEILDVFFEGDKFRIIEEGPQDTIAGSTDYWYFVADEADINYGWVFGAYIAIEYYVDWGD